MADNNNNRAAELPLPPHPAMKQLTHLVGTWENEGAAPGVSTYKLALGGHYMTQQFETTTPSGRKITGIEYITWDEDTQSLRSHLMADDGSNFSYTYQFDDDGTCWTWFGGKDSDNFFKGKLSEDGNTITGRWQWPGGGFDVVSRRYVRRSRGAMSRKAVTYTTNHTYQIVPYDPDWPAWYKQEAAVLRKLFGGTLLEIEHIGSTAIPGMPAKPQLDILVQVKRITDADALNDALKIAGYVAYGDVLKQGGRLFSKWKGDVKVVNLHVYEPDTQAVWSYKAIKQYLLSHPDTAQIYAALKQELYRKYPNDYLKYREHKDPWLKKLETKLPANT